MGFTALAKTLTAAGRACYAVSRPKRGDAGELSDNKLYCYQASKARIRRERIEVEPVTPWLFRTTLPFELRDSAKRFHKPLADTVNVLRTLCFALPNYE
jgi:hypothetical protein